jgi:hypothetical protein
MFLVLQSDPLIILFHFKKFSNFGKTNWQLAKKWHPDVNKGNAEAEKKFQEIQQAYEVCLSSKFFGQNGLRVLERDTLIRDYYVDEVPTSYKC